LEQHAVEEPGHEIGTPVKDQGYFFVQVQTPPGATMERTRQVLHDVVEHDTGRNRLRSRLLLQWTGVSLLLCLRRRVHPVPAAGQASCEPAQ
jgi:hypothetical protein